MNTRAIHVPVILWNTYIVKEEGEHVQAFRVVRKEVQNPPVFLNMRLWVWFESMDHIRELHSVTDEKHREIVSH